MNFYEIFVLGQAQIVLIKYHNKCQYFPSFDCFFILWKKMFLIDGRYQHEINEDNPLGMKGQLVATFGLLLKHLWSCSKYYWEPRKLKV